MTVKDKSKRDRAVATNLQCAYLHGQIEVTYGKRLSDGKFMPTESMVRFLALVILHNKPKKNSGRKESVKW